MTPFITFRKRTRYYAKDAKGEEYPIRWMFGLPMFGNRYPDGLTRNPPSESATPVAMYSTGWQKYSLYAKR